MSSKAAGIPAETEARQQSTEPNRQPPEKSRRKSAPKRKPPGVKAAAPAESSAAADPRFKDIPRFNGFEIHIESILSFEGTTPTRIVEIDWENRTLSSKWVGNPKLAGVSGAEAREWLENNGPRIPPPGKPADNWIEFCERLSHPDSIHPARHRADQKITLEEFGQYPSSDMLSGQVKNIPPLHQVFNSAYRGWMRGIISTVAIENQNKEDAPVVYTMGLVGHTMESVIAGAKSHGINAFAHFAPEDRTAKPEIVETLRDAGITYVHVGNNANGEMADRLVKGAKQFTVAVLGDSQDAAGCDRGMKLGHLLSLKGHDVRHVDAAGEIEEHFDLIMRTPNLTTMKPFNPMVDKAIQMADVAIELERAADAANQSLHVPQPANAR